MSYRIPEYVLARPVHDDVMILDSRHGRYLGLNGTGAIVWSILAEGGSADAAVDELAMNFDVTREHAGADVARLVQELLRLSLIVPAEQ